MQPDDGKGEARLPVGMKGRGGTPTVSCRRLRLVHFLQEDMYV